MHSRLILLVSAATLATATPAAPQTEGAPPQPNIYTVPQEQADLLLQARTQEPAFLEVNGTARVSVPADRAAIVFAVETEGKTAAEASTTNADAMTAVLAAVRGTNAPGLVIETHGYSLSPQYARPSAGEGAPTIDRYRALNNVAVTVTDVDGVGRIIDAAIGAGANRVASLSFEASDTDAARGQALRMAIQRAREEAMAMAEALGVELGPPIEVHGGANVPGPVPQFRAAMVMERAADTPVEAGGQEVVANVTVRFRLGG